VDGDVFFGHAHILKEKCMTVTFSWFDISNGDLGCYIILYLLTWVCRQSALYISYSWKILASSYYLYPLVSGCWKTRHHSFRIQTIAELDTVQGMW